MKLLIGSILFLSYFTTYIENVVRSQIFLRCVVVLSVQHKIQPQGTGGE